MPNRFELPVHGMTCQGCVRHVTSALTAVSGVAGVDVSLEEKQATVTAEESAGLDPQALRAAIERAGYRSPIEANLPESSDDSAPSRAKPGAFSLPVLNHSDPEPARPMPDPALAEEPAEPKTGAEETGAEESTEEVQLAIEGMHCASCVSRVEGALAQLPGVVDARANLATDQARVRFVRDRVTLEALQQAIREAGYTATEATRVDPERGAEERTRWRRRFLVALAGFLTILLTGHLHLVSLGSATLWVHAALATVVQFYVGWPYYRGAWNRLLHFSANMDTLVALGTTTAYGAGVAQLFVEGIELMTFMDATMILTFVSLGKYLETHSKGRASEAIRKLMELAPEQAIVISDESGEERQRLVPATEVRAGDVLLIRAGDRVPLDAEVVDGDSDVDESWLTGEPIPVKRSVGDEVLAGTINIDSPLRARVVRTADATTLSQVVELVRRAQESKTEIQNLADRVVAVFTPIVLAVALVSLLVWSVVGAASTGLLCAVAVLIVACPCAMGLATPTAILVAGGRGAELGILIKEARVLEAAEKLSRVVFDKTGTVTMGEPRVTDADWQADTEIAATLTLAATVEQLSSHPLAAAVVRYADEQGQQPRGNARLVATHGGEGLEATYEGQRVAIGTEQLMARMQVALPQSLASTLDARRREGKTAILLARDEQFLGVLFAEDTVREASRSAIEQLHAAGLTVSLLSGDKQQAAEKIAGQLGIDEVRAEVKPGEKQSEIRRLQQQGERVAMVGDGINDAPALAAADLGFAIGAGADVAIESADVVLVRPDVRLVPQTIRLSRATMRTIRQNLVWAFLYNILLIPLAAGLLLPWGVHVPPWAAAAAMATSSVSVVANSLLLKRKALA